MKFFISLLLIAVLSYAACLYFDWWFVAIVSFAVVFFIPQKPLWAFLCGFASIFILWGALIFILSSRNEHLLANKVSVLILGNENATVLILVSALIGGLVAGFAALTASLTRRAIQKN